MRVYKCVLKIISPIVIADSRTSRGFYTATAVIPGHTMGGAVNRTLKRGASPNLMLISSPAYPVFNGREALPAHPFYYGCKVCEGRFFSTIEAVELRQYTSSGWNDIKARLIALRDELSHPVKSLHPSPVVRGVGGVRVATQSLVAIGMNRHTAASQYGLLFEYLAIEPGQEYWFTLASVSDVEVPSEFEVRIGRGTSRGYGRALVKIKEADSTPSIFHDAGDEVALYAFSPIPLRFISQQINLRGCAMRYGLDDVDGELEPVQIDDRPAAFGRKKVIMMGWPHGAPSSRERLTCLNAGSIILYRWRSKPNNMESALAVLRYFGIPLLLDSGYVDGLCMLHPFHREPLEEVK